MLDLGLLSQFQIQRVSNVRRSRSGCLWVGSTGRIWRRRGIGLSNNNSLLLKLDAQQSSNGRVDTHDVSDESEKKKSWRSEVRKWSVAMRCGYEVLRVRVRKGQRAAS